MLEFDVSYARPFLPANWLSSRLDGLTEARQLLENGEGLGGEFTGWVDLPRSYDREEVHRVLQTARIIRRQSEVLIVVGIGGSYLGARALLELRIDQITTDDPEGLAALDLDAAADAGGSRLVRWVRRTGRRGSSDV